MVSCFSFFVINGFLFEGAGRPNVFLFGLTAPRLSDQSGKKRGKKEPKKKEQLAKQEGGNIRKFYTGVVDTVDKFL